MKPLTEQAKEMSDLLSAGLGFVLIVVVPLVAAGAILRKCGMSLWWLALAFFPPVLLLVAAIRHWPVQDEVSRLRLKCAEGTQADVDIVMRAAIKAEANGDWLRAKSLYELIAQSTSSDEETRSYVRRRLSDQIEANTNINNPYRSPTF
ncbi:MAG: hypothetical protein ACREHD_23330 [Pirellulales bacterium]